MRPAIALLLTLSFAGCAHVPTDAFVEVTQMQLTARVGGAVYHGSLRRESPAVVRITAEVDRRIYGGDLQLTRPNETFGLYQQYGPRDAVPATGETLAHTNFTKAILSSTDHRVMTCDFTDVGGKNARGLCVDDAQRVYDVIFS